LCLVREGRIMRRRDAERDAAPARCGLAPMSSGRPGATVRRYYERLPLAGWTWLGGRRRNPPEIDGDRREIFGNLCPARKHGPRPLKIAADGAPEGVSAAAVRSVKRIRRGTTTKARLSALRLPSFVSGRDPKAHPARQRGNAVSWLFDM
jgi:hypothetical protein